MFQEVSRARGLDMGSGSNRMFRDDTGQSWLELRLPFTSPGAAGSQPGQPPAVCWGEALATASHCGSCPLATRAQGSPIVSLDGLL